MLVPSTIRVHDHTTTDMLEAIFANLATGTLPPSDLVASIPPLVLDTPAYTDIDPISEIRAIMLGPSV